MSLGPEFTQAPAFIQRYGPGGFTIANARYDGAILIINGRVISQMDWQCSSIDPQLIIKNFGESRPELLLIGSGQAMQPLPSDFQNALQNEKISVEVMSTPAACRTLNILLAEDRRVSALLFPIEQT